MTTLRPRNFWVLMYGTCAAPLFWLGQLMLGYWVSAQACYGTDHPTTIGSGSPLRTILFAFDAIAILAALSGFLVAWLSWRATAQGERAHFMAVWGLASSACFLVGIVFTTIGSMTVPLCVR